MKLGRGRMDERERYRCSMGSNLFEEFGVKREIGKWEVFGKGMRGYGRL